MSRARVSSEQSAPAAIPIGVELLDREDASEWSESIGLDELLDTLPLDQSLNELAALMRADQQGAVDEIFRRMGEA